MFSKHFECFRVGLSLKILGEGLKTDLSRTALQKNIEKYMDIKKHVQKTQMPTPQSPPCRAWQIWQGAGPQEKAIAWMEDFYREGLCKIYFLLEELTGLDFPLRGPY